MATTIELATKTVRFSPYVKCKVIPGTHANKARNAIKKWRRGNPVSRTSFYLPKCDDPSCHIPPNFACTCENGRTVYYFADEPYFPAKFFSPTWATQPYLPLPEDLSAKNQVVSGSTIEELGKEPNPNSDLGSLDRKLLWKFIMKFLTWEKMCDCKKVADANTLINGYRGDAFFAAILSEYGVLMIASSRVQQPTIVSDTKTIYQKCPIEFSIKEFWEKITDAANKHAQELEDNLPHMMFVGGWKVDCKSFNKKSGLVFYDIYREIAKRAQTKISALLVKTQESELS
jgi:hypothetical protein